MKKSNQEKALENLIEETAMNENNEEYEEEFDQEIMNDIIRSEDK